MTAIPATILIVIGISVHVPKLLVIAIEIAAPVMALIAAWEEPDLALARVWHSTVIVALAGITAAESVNLIEAPSGGSY